MKTLFITLLVVTGMLAHNETADDMIDWSAERKLEWNDFKGEPEKHLNLVAMTYSSILYKYSVEGSTITIETQASFDKKTSWTKDKESLYLLNHEQLHFDITEVFARRFRKAISEATFTRKNYQSKVRELHNKNINEWKAYQKLYDEETDNSLIKDAQEKWNTKIAAELVELREFEKADKLIKVLE